MKNVSELACIVYQYNCFEDEHKLVGVWDGNEGYFLELAFPLKTKDIICRSEKYVKM